jgi:hypothetical protein
MNQWFYAVKLFSKTACQVCEGQHQWDVGACNDNCLQVPQMIEVQTAVLVAAATMKYGDSKPQTSERKYDLVTSLG